MVKRSEVGVGYWFGIGFDIGYVSRKIGFLWFVICRVKRLVYYVVYYF